MLLWLYVLSIVVNLICSGSALDNLAERIERRFICSYCASLDTAFV